MCPNTSVRLICGFGSTTSRTFRTLFMQDDKINGFHLNQPIEIRRLLTASKVHKSDTCHIEIQIDSKHIQRHMKTSCIICSKTMWFSNGTQNGIHGILLHAQQTTPQDYSAHSSRHVWNNSLCKLRDYTERFRRLQSPSAYSQNASVSRPHPNTEFFLKVDDCRFQDGQTMPWTSTRWRSLLY